MFEEWDYREGTIAILQEASRAAERGIPVLAIGGDMNAAINLLQKEEKLEISDKVLKVTGGGVVFEVLDKGVEGLSPIAALISKHEVTGRDLSGEPDLQLTPEKVKENAEVIIPDLVDALIRASKKDKKVLRALDKELGRGKGNELIKELIESIPTLKENNEELAALLGNLTIISDEGADLAGRVHNISTLSGKGKDKFKPENIIIITKNSTLKI